MLHIFEPRTTAGSAQVGLLLLTRSHACALHRSRTLRLRGTRSSPSTTWGAAGRPSLGTGPRTRAMSSMPTPLQSSPRTGGARRRRRTRTSSSAIRQDACSASDSSQRSLPPARSRRSPPCTALCTVWSSWRPRTSQATGRSRSSTCPHACSAGSSRSSTRASRRSRCTRAARTPA